MSLGSRHRRKVSIAMSCTICDPTGGWRLSTRLQAHLLGRNLFPLGATSKMSKMVG